MSITHNFTHLSSLIRLIYIAIGEIFVKEQDCSWCNSVILGFKPGATIPDPARPHVADRGTALRYGG